MLSADNKCIHNLHQEYEKWLSWDRDPETQEEMRELMAEKDYETLGFLLSTRIDLAPGGFQGFMGAGYCKMNQLVVIQIIQGLLRYLNRQTELLAKKGVVVGYDGRHQSLRFAKLAAAVFLSANIKTYLFSMHCPSHYVSFTTTKHSAVCGIMITASGCTIRESGIKFYGNNGALVIYPFLQEIAHAIEEDLTPRDSSWDCDICDTSPLREDPLNEMMEMYSCSMSVNPLPKPKRKIVYTPLHGVGWEYIKPAMTCAGYPIPLEVTEQIVMDPKVPTIEYPDPKAPSAFELAIATATKTHATVILANDFDAGRLGVAELNDGEWRIFTGNEVGALLGWWMVTCSVKKLKVWNLEPRKAHLFSTALSSRILEAIASEHGMTYCLSFPGAHWVSYVAACVALGGEYPVFGFDEDRGYFCHPKILAIDGITAAVKFTELVAFLDESCENLSTKLGDLYITYGLHTSVDSYYLTDKHSTIVAMFKHIRNFFERNNKSYFTQLKNGKFEVYDVCDIHTMVEQLKMNVKSVLVPNRMCELIAITFTNGMEVTISHVGSSSQLRYFIELAAPPESQGRDEIYRRRLLELVDAFITEVLYTVHTAALYEEETMLRNQNRNELL